MGRAITAKGDLGGGPGGSGSCKWELICPVCMAAEVRTQALLAICMPAAFMRSVQCPMTCRSNKTVVQIVSPRVCLLSHRALL